MEAMEAVEAIFFFFLNTESCHPGFLIRSSCPKRGIQIAMVLTGLGLNHTVIIGRCDIF